MRLLLVIVLAWAAAGIIGLWLVIFLESARVLGYAGASLFMLLIIYLLKENK